jgi:hypothetical protein
MEAYCPAPLLHKSDSNMTQKQNEDVLFEYKDWYRCFTEELFKQRGVSSDMTVTQASRAVAETNPYIKRQLDFIERGESMGGAFLDLAENKPEMIQYMHLDFLSRDYIALYLSLKDEHFASICAGSPGKWMIGPHERDAMCEAFLCKYSLSA